MYITKILCYTINIPAFICQCSWNSNGSVPMWMECWNWHPTNPRERLGEHLQELEEVHTSAGDLMSRSSAGDVAGDHSMSTDIPFPGVGKHEKRKLVFSAVPEKGSFSHVDWSRAAPSLTESSLVTLQLMPIKSMSEESYDLTSRVLILRVLNKSLNIHLVLRDVSLWLLLFKQHVQIRYPLNRKIRIKRRYSIQRF